LTDSFHRSLTSARHDPISVLRCFRRCFPDYPAHSFWRWSNASIHFLFGVHRAVGSFGLLSVAHWAWAPALDFQSRRDGFRGRTGGSHTAGFSALAAAIMLGKRRALAPSK
jgi:hypothetical protein